MSDAIRAEVRTIDLPWCAWHGDRRERLEVPASWRIQELRMADGPALTDAEIGRAFDAPVEAPPLQALLAGKRRVAIAIDDITRPTRTTPLLRLLVDRLIGAGVLPENVTIIVATGAHRRATDRDVELKVGRDLLAQVRVVSHDPAGDLVTTGVALGGVPVRLNREFAAADLRIAVGAVMPHPFAGFGGGGKAVIPGLADLDVLARTHKFAMMGFKGGAVLDGNRFRLEMERAVRQIGLQWTVSVAVNAQRDAAFISAGDLVSAHRQAAAAAASIGSTPAPDGLLDALVVNAYPKDGELLQIESALVALRNGMLQWLVPGAPVVLMGACPEGLGHHDLFGPGGRLFRVPAPRSSLAGRKLWVFAPHVADRDVRMVFPDCYPSYHRWEALIASLSRELRADASIGIVPCGPLQLAGQAGAGGELPDRRSRTAELV